MRPDDTQLPSNDPRGSISPPARDYSNQHEAVANITRDQIEAVYQKQAEAEANNDSNVYHRNHTEQHGVPAQDWQKYHSSWQNYYQKYYEQYYVDAVRQTHHSYQQHVEQLKAQHQPSVPEEPIGSLSKEQAMNDIRSQILSKVQSSAKKVRGSRHFVPIIASVAVLLLFVFLQYNSMILAYAVSYVSPGNVNPQNIIVDPNTSLAVDPAPRLIIPKINVDIAVDYDAKSDSASQLAAMKSSVAYFGIPGANSKPGQLGNIPIAGHSSNDFTDTGAAKFIFARLEQLEKDDTFYLNYNGTRYTYTITEKRVVAPTDVSSLQVGSDKPMATLITCVPLGTANNRLLIFAEQISPSPSTATAAPTSSGSDSPPQIAGKSPTLIERAFGAR